MFHKNKVDVSATFAQPEEKLWHVVKDHWKQPEHSDNTSKGADDSEKKKGIKLHKNSVIKLGRVRLRVRDIDYETAESVSASNLLQHHFST